MLKKTLNSQDQQGKLPEGSFFPSMCDLNQQRLLIQHIQDSFLIAPSVSPSVDAHESLLYCDLKPFSLLRTVLLLCPLQSTRAPWPSFFFVSKNPWYVLARNSKNSAFSLCPPKLSFTPTAFFFLLCTLSQPSFRCVSLAFL